MKIKTGTKGSEVHDRFEMISKDDLRSGLNRGGDGVNSRAHASLGAR